MTSRRVRLPLVFVGFLVLALPAAAGPLQREADAIVMSARGLGALHGRPISSLRVYALREDRFVPVPYQFDERDAKGDLVFPNGPRARRDEDDGRLDAGDEVVFMAWDAGDKAEAAVFPSGWKTAVPIEIADPVDGHTAWVYVLDFDAPPAPSPVDYVRYEAATNTIRATRYAMGFDPRAPIGIGYLAATPAGGGDGRNTIDRLKIRFSATTLGGLMKIERNEEQFTSKVVAWIDGPVRVVRHTQNRIVLLLNIPSPSAMLDNVYYANQFEFPTEADLPFDPQTLISNPRFVVSTDARCALPGMTFRNEKNPRPAAIDGVMSAEEAALDTSAYAWMAVTMPSPGKGAWLNRLTYDKSLGVTPELFYVDRLDAPDPPENESGQCGNLGYSLVGMEKLKKGRLRLNSIMYNIPAFSDAEIPRYLDILDRPLRATARSPLTPDRSE